MIEMMLVIFVLSIFLLVLPFRFQRDALYVKAQLLHLKEELLYTQGEAMRTKERQSIKFQNGTIRMGNRVHEFQKGMQCQGKDFFYTEEGHVPFAQSITCGIRNAQQKLVIQLGSGQIDAR